jgi:hypothetical protein
MTIPRIRFKKRFNREQHLKIIEVELKRMIPYRQMLRTTITAIEDGDMRVLRDCFNGIVNWSSIECPVCEIVRSFGGLANNPLYRCCPAWRACEILNGRIGPSFFALHILDMKADTKGLRKIPEWISEPGSRTRKRFEQTLKNVDRMFREIEKRKQRTEARKKVKK